MNGAFVASKPQVSWCKALGYASDGFVEHLQGEATLEIGRTDMPGMAAPLPADSMLPRYSLEAHVHACTTDDGIVLLDLRKNAYSGFDADDSRLLTSMVAFQDYAGRSLLNPFATCSPSEFSRADALADELSALGLIRRGSQSALSRPEVPIVTAEEELLGPIHTMRHRPTVGEWFRMLHASARTAASLRLRSLERTVEVIRACKKRQPPVGASPDLDTVRQRMWNFDGMRPLIYSHRKKCLFDSITLMHFMMHQGIFPTWIVGVQTRPFRAHAWVQLDKYVLYGVPSYIREFVPILVI